MTELRDALVVKLEDENDFLRERVRQLMKELGQPDVSLVPLEWGLTRTEQAVIEALIAREFASKEFIMHFLYNDRPDDPPEQKIIDVLVCKARAKLAPFGIKVETLWGRGYRLDPVVRAQFGKSATGAEHAA